MIILCKMGNFMNKNRKTKRLLFFFATIIALGLFFFHYSKTNDLFHKSSAGSHEKNISEFSISIPKLNVNAPVIKDVDGTNKDEYFKALENGVAQMKGSAKPGENSNIVIFGHSSFYKDKPGNYKEVFKELDNLSIKDEIKIRYNGKDFSYYVASKKIIEPTNVAVTEPTNVEKLTIITCWPPGSIEKRYLIVAAKN